MIPPPVYYPYRVPSARIGAYPGMFFRPNLYAMRVGQQPVQPVQQPAEEAPKDENSFLGRLTKENWPWIVFTGVITGASFAIGAGLTRKFLFPE
jgi:hypothetical protein